jgi:hypothetical protein
MPHSAAYLEFRRQLGDLKSKDRVNTLVSEAGLWARNLPVSVPVNTTALVSRVARHKGIDLDLLELDQAALLLERSLQRPHH